jgi:hypothetical protein
MYIRKLAALCFILVLLALSSAAQARSTFAARFAKEAIAGPGQVREAVLYLHYFAGDGEAIVRSEFACETAGVRLVNVRSTLGTAAVNEIGIAVDYSNKPLGGERVDTLLIDLDMAVTDQLTRWRGQIYSSLEDVGKAAHTAYFPLAVESPLKVQIEATPARVFPGEDVALELVVHNADTQGRALAAIQWMLPEGFSVNSEQVETRWKKGLAPGQRDTLKWQVRIDPRQAESVVLQGVVQGQQIHGSSIPKVEIEVAPVPHARLNLETPVLTVGERANLVFEVFNPGDVAIELDELRLEVPSVFTAVELLQHTDKAKIVSSEGGRGQDVIWQGIGTLSPGQKMGLALAAKPIKSGPFNWDSYFKPARHFWFVPVRGEATLVHVVRGQQEDLAEQKISYATDLQLVSNAFGAAVANRLKDLPLPPGRRIYLRADAKHNGNWVVEDILHQALPERGYEITFKDPQEESLESTVMHYRLVDARVVYSPNKKRWGLFDGGRRREVFGDLLLRLQNAAGTVLWADRIETYGTDEVSSAAAQLLGESEVVERTEIAADNKVVELGLTGSIIGGLVYIFFVP